MADKIDDLSFKFEELNKKSQTIDQLQTVMSRPITQLPEAEGFDNEFDSYIGKGKSLEMKSMNSVSGEDGGFLVSKSIYQIVNSTIDSLSLLRKLASVEKISTNFLDLIEEQGVMGSAWVLETANREVTENKSFTKRTINTHEMYAQPKATQKLLDDASVNIEKWLAEKIGESFAGLEAAAFFKGKGGEMPRGILTFDQKEIQATKIAADKTINYDNIMDLVHSLPYEYHENASLIAHPQAICELRKIKDKASGIYLWHPAIESGKANMIFGLPIYEDRNMPQIADGNIAIVLADFKKAYKIVDRAGIKILRDPYTEKPFVKFYATKRVGADLIDRAAIKYLVC